VGKFFEFKAWPWRLKVARYGKTMGFRLINERNEFFGVFGVSFVSWVKFI